MNKKRIILCATIAVAIIMAITCPSREQLRNANYNRTKAQAEKYILLAGDDSEYVYAGMETSLTDAVDVHSTYVSLLLFSYSTCHGKLISIGFLGNVISVNDIEL